MPGTEWNSTTTPEEGAIVYVLAADNRGQYAIPFPVVFRDDSWWNAQSNDDAQCIWKICFSGQSRPEW